MTYVLRTEPWDDPHVVGGKSAALARALRAGLAVPRWVVVTPEALLDSLEPAVRNRLLDGAEGVMPPPDAIDRIWPSPQVCQELHDGVQSIGAPGNLFAVRSSALDEDGAEHSFAGQLASFLFVALDDVPDRVARVWRSGFTERVLAYRRERGLRAFPRPPAVVVQRMVDANVSGVAFGADPVSGRRDVVVISAVHGLGTSLVSGESDADSWRVDRENRILDRVIARKTLAHRADAGSLEGVVAAALAASDGEQPALADEQIRAVADLTRRCGEVLGRPQDIEWAIADGRLWLLQSRPITSLGQVADSSGVLAVWDNSNIAESYSGVTTPLTFSFARTAYEGVYREFCRIMGVAPSKLAAHDLVFRRMLGLVRGRIYYNLESWYRTLALLPGYTVNRRFMEQMMGVREGLPAGLLDQQPAASRRARAADAWRLLRSVAGLVANHVRLQRTIARFYVRLTDALGPQPPAFGRMRADELASHYYSLEAKLLKRWDAPLINDFFAMIFHGVLRRLAGQWCGPRASVLQNDLLRGEGGMISVEPARRLREMAILAAPRPDLVAVLCDGSLGEIEAAMASVVDLRARYLDYVERFGDRCLEELKLESPTLHDDPLILLRSIGQMARRYVEHGLPSGDQVEARVRQEAEDEVRAALRQHRVRRIMFFWVLRQARGRMRDRENLRFERTRLFGRVRRVFVELGRRFHEAGSLDDPRDIFWLEVDEALGFIDATATVTDLRGIVAVRKAEFQRHREGPAPDGRFETRGMVHVGNTFRARVAAVAETPGEERQGLGCCAGVVRGRVRVVIDPRGVRLERNEILVAVRTDPGWVMLFPAAAGLIVQHGSLLSHSAIVARELGLPAIVSVAGVTEWLADGDLVEMDGATGLVRRLAPVVPASDAMRSASPNAQ